MRRLSGARKDRSMTARALPLYGVFFLVLAWAQLVWPAVLVALSLAGLLAAPVAVIAVTAAVMTLARRARRAPRWPRCASPPL
jgi:hypothetical protein